MWDKSTCHHARHPLFDSYAWHIPIGSSFLFIFLLCILCLLFITPFYLIRLVNSRTSFSYISYISYNPYKSKVNNSYFYDMSMIVVSLSLLLNFLFNFQKSICVFLITYFWEDLPCVITTLILFLIPLCGSFSLVLFIGFIPTWIPTFIFPYFY